MKLNVYKLFLGSVKWIVFLSLLNLVLPIEATENPVYDGKYQLSITEQVKDSADDGLVLSIQARQHQRTRRLKRVPTANFSTEFVLPGKLNTFVLLSTNDKSTLYRCDLVLKHHRGPPLV